MTFLTFWFDELCSELKIIPMKELTIKRGELIFEGETKEFIDNTEFIQLMKISARTAQRWRSKGMIAYFLVGRIVYYRLSDVKRMIEGSEVNR